MPAAAKPGDSVVALLPQHGDPEGLPLARPVVGEVYTVRALYPMFYGVGVQLEGLDSYPYRGYFYYVEPGNKLGAQPGAYFRRLQPVRLPSLKRALEHV